MESKLNLLLKVSKFYLLIPFMFILFGLPAFLLIYYDSGHSTNVPIGLSVDVSSSDEFFAKGMAAERLGDTEKSINFYIKAMENGHPIAKNYIVEAAEQGNENAIDALLK